MRFDHRIPVVFVSVLILVAGITSGFQGKEFSQTVDFQPGDKITLKTFKGSILLSSWDRPEVSIFARITAPEGEDDDYAAAVVDATRIDVQQKSHSLVIRSDYDDVPSKGSWFSNSKTLAYVHYEIRTPRQVDLRVDDFKSTIELYELSGRINLETYKGTLKANDLSGKIRLETFKGKAELSGLRGRLDVETFKGSVSLQAMEIDGTSKLETYKGNIELAIPETQGLSLRADLGRRASLTGDFGLDSARRDRRDSTRFEGSINNGGPRLEVSSHKGDIRLKRW
ncbi:MAG: DUF4097 family beta strand repeat-containing protein [Acidobacteriota bacterium]